MKKLLLLSSLLVSGLLNAQAPYPYSQNFDAVTTNGATPSVGSLPSGWTTTSGFKVYGMENLGASHGNSPFNACTTEMNSNHTQDTLVTPTVGITANTKISLAYRFVNKANYPNTGYQLVSGDQVTIDANLGPLGWQSVATINYTTNPTPLNSYTTYTYACTNCASLIGFGVTSIQVRMDVARAAGSSDWYLDIDDFQVADVLSGIATSEAKNPSISVFPNPSNGNFSVSLNNYQANGQVEVTVYNFLGQKIKSLTAEGAVNNQINVNTAGLEKGMYLVEVKSGSEVAKAKVQID